MAEDRSMKSATMRANAVTIWARSVSARAARTAGPVGERDGLVVAAEGGVQDRGQQCPFRAEQPVQGGQRRVCHLGDRLDGRGRVAVLGEQAASASAFTGTVLLIGMTAGSALGGALVAAAGVTAAFAVNAASFLADAAVLSTIQAGKSPQVKRAPRQVREGFSYVAHTPELRAPLLALALIAALAFTMQVSVPTLIHRSFSGGPAQIGAALTALAAGSLTGTLVRAARGMPRPRALPMATVIMASGLAATAIAPVLPAALAGLAAVGIGWSCILGTTIAILQSAEPRMLGRVMSLFALVLLGGMSAGAPVASSLSASLGPRALFFADTAAAIAALAVVAGSARTRPPARQRGTDGG